MNGVAIKQDFTTIWKAPSVTVTETIGNDCNAYLIALAESTITDSLKNDFHSVYWSFNEFFTSVELSLQKKVNGVYEDIETLDNDDFGTFFDFGFYETIYSEKSIGYLLDWQKVLDTHSTGNYRIKCEATNFDATINTQYSFEFYLQEYSDEVANETVFIEFYQNGNIGSQTDLQRKTDFGFLNFKNGIRIPNAKFGKPTPTLNEEFTRYQSGKNIFTKRGLEIEYQLALELTPLWVVKYIDAIVNMNSEAYITDYNLVNFEPYQRFGIKVSSASQPEFDDSRTTIEAVFKYIPLFNNFEHKRG